jgi:hypothetical protein
VSTKACRGRRRTAAPFRSDARLRPGRHQRLAGDAQLGVPQFSIASDTAPL